LFKEKHIAYHFKKLAKENKYLFWLWFTVYRKNKGTKISYINKDTNIYIDGYPRSGNTFFIHLVKELFPFINSVHHLHAIAPLKIAMNKGIPIIILLREPQEAIASNYLKKYSLKKSVLPENLNVSLINDLTKEYIDYYYFIEKISGVNIFDFVSFINFPTKAMIEVAKIINSEINTDTLDKQVKKAVQKFGGAPDPLGSSKPSQLKEYHKQKVKNYLETMDIFPEPMKIYHRLYQRSSL